MYTISFLKGIILGAAFEISHPIDPLAYFFLCLDEEYNDKEDL